MRAIGPRPTSHAPRSSGDPPLRMRGHRKDHRPTKPQIVIGLLAGAGGRVLRHRVYPGNRQDQRVAADLIKDARALAPGAGGWW
jgi:transposase